MLWARSENGVCLCAGGGECLGGGRGSKQRVGWGAAVSLLIPAAVRPRSCGAAVATARVLLWGTEAELRVRLRSVTHSCLARAHVESTRGTPRGPVEQPRRCPPPAEALPLPQFGRARTVYVTPTQ